jgi:hypothetical protein
VKQGQKKRKKKKKKKAKKQAATCFITQKTLHFKRPGKAKPT